MNILGINAWHGDSSAALLREGRLIAAVEEERFNRVKHWAGFPVESIRWCLSEAKIGLEELDHVAISMDPNAHLVRRLAHVLRRRPSIHAVRDRLKRRHFGSDLRQTLIETGGISDENFQTHIHHVEHHDTHLAHAYYPSPFPHAAILSIDGMGDFVSTVTALGGESGAIDPLRRVYYPHSLGFLYNAITLYLGFPSYGDEYKVMGLAPYGEPEYLGLFRRIIRPKGSRFALNLDYFTHPSNGITMAWENGSPKVDPFHSPLLEKELGPMRKPDDEIAQKHKDIAASLQAVTEEILFHVLRCLHNDTGEKRLCLAGGVAMNSVAAGKILQETPFEELYLPFGAADNGTAIGAALHVWNGLLANHRGPGLDHAYWGSVCLDEDCARALEENRIKAESFDEDELMRRTVTALGAGKVVGWFHGRMEFGARALGNRSLLADPRRADMREILNRKIKRRESFRPFAPSILEEYVADFFDHATPAPFMERVLPVRRDKRDEIPAVVHVDGTGRLQTVSKEANPRYWKLIDAFRQATGIPVLLNTSFNENEPIVRTPEEAIQCFLRTGIDVLVLGNHYVERESSDKRSESP